MKKTDKKIDKQICQALTKACEMAKDQVTEFQWLTHLVNYNQFPESLSVICIFDSRAGLKQAQQQGNDQFIVGLIKRELEQINIRFKDIKQHVSFDIEEVDELGLNGKG
ncbi:MAG: Fis family transcriptional regulator [Methylococcaceae bacterium]|nr:Fis family transcriptional regulator [Methylococcaceae bacterium]